MADDEFQYDRMVEEALRSVVGKALIQVVERGLPGEHHLYITFRSDHPDVVMPDHLRARYPSEMTIVLQYQFWGLEIGPDAFGITLSFANVPERLTVPFEALVAFADPSKGTVGLSGEHHFYITFRSDHPDVVMPDHLRARYPSEMTIVLQYQFWGLEIGPDAFGITLSFANVPERLTVPFEALVAFADPSVPFGLQFESGAGTFANERVIPKASGPID